MKKITQLAEENPWIFLVFSGWFAYQALDSFRTFLKLNVVKEATEITKDAADA